MDDEQNVVDALVIPDRHKHLMPNSGLGNDLITHDVLSSLNNQMIAGTFVGERNTGL